MKRLPHAELTAGLVAVAATTLLLSVSNLGRARALERAGVAGEVGACCSITADVTCAETTLEQCTAVGGDWLGAGTTCLGHEPCCLPDGGCLFIDRVCCEAIGGDPQGPDVDCAFITCAEPPLGACCLDIDDGPLRYDTCFLATQGECEAGGGHFNGPETTCGTAPCCLPGGFCQETDPECCLASGGLPGGPGSSCATGTGCPCIGDVDGDGVVDIDDVVLLVLSWGPCPIIPPCIGDVDGNGVVDVDDLVLVVLNFGPCP